MIIVLCHADDSPALWLHETLRDFGVEGLELVVVDQLVYSRRIVHRLDQTGDAGEIRLADGRVIRAECIRGLVNRMRYLPTQHFASADETDRAYATQELSAFLLAWLDSIAGRVINPPLPFALDGGACDPLTLAQLASTAGLPTTIYRTGTNGFAQPARPALPVTHVPIVFDGRVFGRLLPRSLQDACRRLAMLLNVPLLQVMLHQSRDDEWRFVSASCAADFRAGGRALASAIAQACARPRCGP